MVLPKTNRCVMFDAQYLHGVIPGRGANSSPHSNARRLTFMVGFWKNIAAKDRGTWVFFFGVVIVVVLFVCVCVCLLFCSSAFGALEAYLLLV